MHLWMIIRRSEKMMDATLDSWMDILASRKSNHTLCELKKYLCFLRLQKYKDGGLSDATTFALADGLRWRDPAGRTRTEADLGEWMGARAGSGRMAPRGFPRDNRFD